MRITGRSTQDVLGPRVIRNAKSLRSLPPGTTTALTVTKELDGPIHTFGERFWDLVLASTPDLASRLSRGIPIATLAYRDRYVRSPLTMRAVIEVVRGLRMRFPDAVRDVVARLITSVDRPRRDQSEIWHDWHPSVDRGVIFSHAGASAGYRGEAVVVLKHEAAHARELEITWVDGAVWRVRLDEGFGFLRSRVRTPYDFAIDPDRQGKALGASRYDVVANNPTAFYVFHPGT